VSVATIVPASIVVAPEDAELGVHALAQVAEEVRLELAVPLDPNGAATRTARAYGITHRIGISASATPTARRVTLAELVNGYDPVPAARMAGGSLAGQRVVVVTNVPTHYRVALFNVLSRYLSEEGATLRVLFLARTPSKRAWMQTELLEFEHEYARGLDRSRGDGRRVVPVDLESRLSRFAPTNVLVGGFSPAVAGRVALMTRRRPFPFGIWSGELASRPTARRRLRRWQRTALLRRASYGVAYGSRAAAYLRSLNRDIPIVIGRNTAPLPEPRSGRGSETVDLLSVARAEGGKAIDLLVDAVRARRGMGCRLSIVGDGPALSSLQARAAGDERIRFLGALPPREVRELMGEADVFLFPSKYDVFGLALVEAMGAGLACVVSPMPGAVPDLCVSGENSVVLEGGLDAWGAAIERLVEDADLRARLGRAASETVHGRWTIEHAARAMLAGFRLPFLNIRPGVG
jgi:glycosyltransferase involved in cell wall biosynthesis